MSYNFKLLSSEKFTVNGHVIYKDTNEQWIASPPIENMQLQKVVNNYIESIDV